MTESLYFNQLQFVTAEMVEKKRVGDEGSLLRYVFTHDI